MAEFIDYDFNELVSIINKSNDDTINFDPIQTKVILGVDNMTSAMKILSVLCELKVIIDYAMSEDWSLSLFKE